MANAIQLKYDAAAAVTITLSSLTTGSGRQGTFINNSSNRPGALIYVKIKSGGTGPTAGSTYSVYLVRRDNHASPTLTDDNAGSSDAALTVLNSRFLGNLKLTNSSATNFTGSFDTSDLGPLGPSWTIAVVNNSGQTTDTTAGNHVVEYVYYYQEIQ